jgi:acetyltransferase-like isoleucine patch superfamily enzyme
MYFFKLLYIAIIVVIPMPKSIRAFLYGLIPGYSIGKKCRIGISVLNVDILKINDYCMIENFCHVSRIGTCTLAPHSTIRNRTVMMNIDRVHLMNNSIIGVKNSISGPNKDLRPITVSFTLGPDSSLSAGHQLDLCDSITIGSNVVFAGAGSQAYTHYFDLERNRVQAPITIGNNVYIGARSILLPGISICDDVVFHVNSVVDCDVVESGVYSSNTTISKIGSVHNLKDYYPDKILCYHNNKAFIKLK